MIPDDADADLRRRFDALISGLGLDGLSALAEVMPLRRERIPRPELRRPPLSGQYVFRVRVDLDDSDPVIWRRLDLRSDLPLDVVHQAIQSAFGWWDYHLNRLTLGGLTAGHLRWPGWKRVPQPAPRNERSQVPSL